MKSSSLKKTLAPAMGIVACIASSHNASAQAFTPGDLIVSGSSYQDTGAAAGLVPGVTPLPGGGTANASGSYPNVFSNEGPDPSFGVTSGIFLQNLTTGGSLVNTVTLDSSEIVTSFSSKSELGLNVSTDGKTVTFMGYNGVAGIGALDVSNSNTPNHVDPTDPVTSSTQRAVGEVNLATGALSVTDVNSYSGNNGRAAILANNVNGSGQDALYLVGNAGNGSGTEPANIVNNTGVQLATPGVNGETTVVGQQQGTAGSKNGFQYGYSVTQNGDPADKSGKDDNFRGETIFNNTLYVTKGSGNNGIDTVYQVGAAGILPTAATASSTAISILPGFNTTLASAGATGAQNFHPFGLFFANATTLYVADEGDGNLAHVGTSLDPNAGLEKWSLVAGVWKLDYTLQAGLSLGQNYTVTGTSGGVSGTYTTASDGLRALAGKVNADGTISLYAVTSTVSTATDQGADPNKLVAITDTLADTTASQAAGESFTTLESAAYGQVLRGVAFAPVPEPSTMAAGLGALALLAGMFRRRKN